MNVHKTTKTIRKCGSLNIQFLASFLRSTHPARPSLPASASRPVKIHVGKIKIIQTIGGPHLGDKAGFWIMCGLFACVASCVIAFALRMRFAGRVVKEKGEPRGENDHGSFPLVLSGQRRAAGRTHDPRFLSRQSGAPRKQF